MLGDSLPALAARKQKAREKSKTAPVVVRPAAEASRDDRPGPPIVPDPVKQPS